MANSCFVDVHFPQAIHLKKLTSLIPPQCHGLEINNGRTVISYIDIKEPDDNKIKALTQVGVPFRAYFQDLPMGLAGFYVYDGQQLKKNYLSYMAAANMFNGEPVEEETSVVKTLIIR